VKHDVNDDGGRMMFGRQMTPEEYDEEYARLLQEFKKLIVTSLTLI